MRSNGTNTLLAAIQAADVPTLNQNTTGTAANITATTNTTLTTLSSLSLAGSQVTGNISGNAANVTGTVAIANGGTGQTTANAAFNALVPSQTGNSGKYLTTDGTDTSWAANPLGTVTSVGGTGTVSGISLSGTVTTSGNLTLGGTLNLSSPPAIGNTTPSTGNFTTLTENSVAVVTQSDIGSAPNEIPLNQYLGSLAYQNGDAYYNTGMTVGFRNRIINGAMVIDQRNAGAAITTSTGFPVDRFNYSFGGGAFTAQRISDAPSGFVNSLRISCTATASADVGFETKFEGNNIFDIGFGSANASLMTLSFWVKSNLTGQFSAFLYRPDANRSCVLGYTINVANTWEYKTILIPADSTGAVTATNGEGLRLDFFLALSSATGSPSVWKSLDSQRGITGQVNLGSSTSNTWQITGVQLEKGNIATSFDVRPYGTELALCQRYYYRITSTGDNCFGSGWAGSGTQGIVMIPYPVTMRTKPTALEQSGTASNYRIIYSNTASVCNSVPTFSAITSEITAGVNFFVASGLTTGIGLGAQVAPSITAYLGWSAEL